MSDDIIANERRPGLMPPGLVTKLRTVIADVASLVASLATLSGTVTAVQATATAAMPKAGGVFTGGVATAAAALTDGASVAPNLAAGNCFTWSIASAGARTLANPSGGTAGRGGHILITNTTGAAITLTLGSAWKLAYAGASVPALAAGGVYRVDFLWWSDTRVSTAITREQA